MVGTSLVIASFGFLVYSVTSASAKKLDGSNVNSNYRSIPINDDGSISVKFSDEQLNKIIPKNADGSINIKLSEDQLKALSPSAIQSVNIAEVNGNTAGCYSAYRIGETQYYGLATKEINPW